MHRAPALHVRMGRMTELEIHRRVQDAEARRRPHLAGVVQDAFRVVNGPADGAPAGLTLDRYGRWLVLCARASLDESVVQTWAMAAHDALDADGIVVKRLAPRAADSSSSVFRGALPSAPMAVREDDATFLCDLDDGLSTGLFLDLHDVRRRTRRYVGGGRVLNLFSYTASFSVHAALAGASQVTSVDVSKKALRRGRANMEASGLDPAAHRWFPDDVLDHIERARRRGQQYRLVILDPPAFGRAGGKAFALDDRFESMVEAVVPLVEPGGVLLLSVHTGAIDGARMESAVMAAGVGRAHTVLEQAGLPEWDHPCDGARIGDRGDYLRVLVMKLG